MDSGGVGRPFLTSALDGDEWSASGPGRFTPGERTPRYSLGRRLDVPQSWSRRCRTEINLVPLSGIEPQPSSPYPITILTELQVANRLCCVNIKSRAIKILTCTFQCNTQNVALMMKVHREVARLCCDVR
jgi:hypothetical protein